MMKDLLKTTLLYDLYKKIEFNRFKRQFNRKINNSDLRPNNIFPLDILTIGKYSYGELNIVTFNNKAKLKIGNYVSIAQEVYFILDAEHYNNRISTFPFKVKIIREMECEAFSKGDIVIDDDVWIGHGARILSGVHIGQGSVIAAGAVVINDVEPYSIVGGVPAKKIKYRFEQDVINELLKIDFSKLSKESIDQNIDNLYQEIKSVNDLEWIEKCNNLKRTDIK